MSDGLISDYAYMPGDEIFHSKPWIFSILPSKLTTHCYHCLERPRLDGLIRRCAGCRLAGYCQEVCQKADWKSRHRDECPVLKCVTSKTGTTTLPEDELDHLMVLLKIISKLKRNKIADAAGTCWPPGTRTFNDLLSHESELLRQRPTLLNSYNLLKPYLDAADAERQICRDYLTFLRLLGRFLINNFAIYDIQHPAVTAVGRGLYLQPSILDHSCLPNALQISLGKTVKISAIRAIARKTDVRVAYMSPFDLIEKRRAYLERSYFFTCQCQACTDSKLIADRNAFRCANASCNVPVPLLESGRGRCHSCSTENFEQWKTAETVSDCLREVLLNIERCRHQDPQFAASACQELETAIKQARLFLHPTNFLLSVAQKNMVGMLGQSDSQLTENMENLLRAIESRREHVGDYCYQPCFLAVKWLVKTNKEDQAITLATKVTNFFKLIAGADSLLYKTWCEHLSAL